MDSRNARGAGGAEEGEMGIDRSRDFDVSMGERILAGEDVGPRDLVDLLTIAAAPPYGHETAGEDAAVMAFRAARRRPAERGNRRPAVVRWAALLGAKTAAVLTVAVVATGAALAAGTGVLPNPFRQIDAPPTSPASVTNPAGESKTNPAVPGSAETGPPTGVPPVTVPPGSAPPSAGPPASLPPIPAGPPPTVPASMAGVCRAYLEQEARHPGSAKDNPSFASLIAAAGGADQAPSYCAAVLGEPTTLQSSPDAGAPGVDGSGAETTGAPVQ